MHENTEPTTPVAFTVTGAASYSGLTRTYLYENRNRLEWIKVGRRSLITRISIDRLLLLLLQQTQNRARPYATGKATNESAKPGGAQ